MAASVPNAEVLERLLIEVVGDDSGLRQVLDEAVAYARQAAQAMRDALAVDLSKLQREAEGVTQSFNTAGAGLGDLSRQFQQQLGEMQAAFDKVRDAGDKSVQEFEAYRRAALEALEALRPMATAAFGSAEAFEALVQHVRTATYQQRQQRDETEKSRQSEEDLADTIKRLTNEVRSQRNLWAGRITDDAEFRESTTLTRAELEALLRTVERGSDEYRKITQEIAYAQRGLDSVNKVASRGGLAWTAQIALANQFGQQLRNLGPAGNIAAGALGIVGGAFGSLQAPLKMSDLSITKILASFTRLTFIVAPLATAVGAIAGAAGLGALTLSAAKAAQELENATHRTGLTIEGLQELQHAARVTGVPLELLSTTMQRLQRRAADANAGNKGLQQAFRQLGVTLTDGEGRMRSTEDLLGQVADGLNRVENNADRVALAFKVFDTEGGRLLPLLKEGSEGIRQLREEARELGLVVSGDTVMSLVDFQKEVETVKRQFEVLKIEVGAAFLPLMRDVLIPLLQDQVIPWIQQAAAWIDEFSDAFFDTSEAGEAFRADTIKNLQAVIMLGRGVVAAAAAVAGAVQSILGIGAGAFGAGEGLRRWATTTGKDLEIIREQRAQIVESIAQQEQQLADLLAGRLPEGYPEGAVPRAIEQLEANIAAVRARLEEFDRLYPQGFIGAVVSGAEFRAENLMGGALDSFQVMLDVLEADIPAMIEAWAAGIAPRVGRAARTIGDGVGTGIGDGVEKALPGSIAFAREKVQEFTKAFDNAVTDEARRIADEQREHWQAVYDAMVAPFKPEEAGKAAREWAQRLATELDLGLKAPLEVRALILPRVEELRAEAAAAIAAGDMDALADVQAKLQPLEGLLSRIAGTAVKLGGAAGGVTVAIDQNTLAASAFLAAQEANRQEASRILDVYSQIGQMGASLADRMAFLKDTPFAGAVMTGPDMSDVVSLEPIATAAVAAQTEVERLRGVIVAMLAAGEDEADILAVIHRLTTLSPMSVAALNELTDGWYTARNAVKVYTQTAEDAFNELPGALPVVATLTARLTPALAEARERARALGEEFDIVAAEQAALTSVITELGSKASLTAGEVAVYEQAVARLAELNTAKAGQATDDLFRAWLEGVNQLGVSLDPLDQAALALSTLGLSSEQVTLALEALAAAGDRLQQAEFDATLESWTESVQRIGLASDPIRDARQALDELFAGKEDTEEYAAALALLAEAAERLKNAELDKEAEKIKRAWETAAGQLADALGVDMFDAVTSKWDEMRKAAQDAAAAGLITADELKKALKAIGILEVADGFRQVAAELGEVAGIVPNLAADLTEAFAMFTAGNTAGGIATAFQAATTAVRGLGAALEDEARRGEAALDLIIGGAAALATALGGPAMGQAVGAVGEFVKSILGDLSNGLAEIQRQVDQATTRSTYLGESLIQGIADANTRQVSRGGLLGLLGFTKAALDEDAFRAAVTLAEGIANGLVNTLRAGDFEEAWKSMIDDILIQGIIERFMARDAIQQAIEDAFLLMDAGDTAGAARRLDRVKEDFRFIWEQIQEIIGATDEMAVNVSGALTSGFTSALNSSTWAEAWDSATLMMKNTLRDAIIQAFIEGEAMKLIFDRFNTALANALDDGVISEEELKELERIFAESEGPLQELWDALEALGLGFDDLNETVNNVTSSMSNVPSVFLDTQAMFDSVAARGGWSTSTLTQPAGAPVMNITFEGPVYGMDDFESRVTEAVNRSGWRGGLAAHGVSR